MILGLSWCYIGIMEEKMEATIMGYIIFRIHSGVSVLGCGSRRTPKNEHLMLNHNSSRLSMLQESHARRLPSM